MKKQTITYNKLPTGLLETPHFSVDAAECVMETSTVKSAALLAYDLIRAKTPPGILPSGVCCVYCSSSLKARNVVYKVK